MPKSFNCPNCGAPLDYNDSTVVTLRCPFCNNPVIVPEELRAGAALPTGQLTAFNWTNLSPAIKLGLIFLILIFVVPICLGIAGTLVGIAASIGAPLLVFLLALLRH